MLEAISNFVLLFVIGLISSGISLFGIPFVLAAVDVSSPPDAITPIILGTILGMVFVQLFTARAWTFSTIFLGVFVSLVCIGFLLCLLVVVNQEAEDWPHRHR